MRRFLLLQAAGAQSFLAGVGSLFPYIDCSFFRHIKAGGLREASLLIAEAETPLFAVFMAIGWHKALRYAAKHLGLIGAGERRPMAEASPQERSQIESALALLDQARVNLGHKGVL